MDAQLIDQYFGGGAHIVLGAHWSLLAWLFAGILGIIRGAGPALFRPEPIKFNSVRFEAPAPPSPSSLPLS
jgi:hypothetical protein